MLTYRDHRQSLEPAPDALRRYDPPAAIAAAAATIRPQLRV